MSNDSFRVLVVRLDTGKGELLDFGSVAEIGGGSGLAAALFDKYGVMDAPWDHPDQPLIFACGPLNCFFPLMSKTVCTFKSPYHDQYSESHAGGRLSFAMRFAGYHAIVILGRAHKPSALIISSRGLEVKDVHYMWGADTFSTGKLLRRTFPKKSGVRSIIRIGPAGENKCAYACINVDTFRHFGRMGSGGVMGAKHLKGIIVQGDSEMPLPEGKAYTKLFDEVYKDVTATHMMDKYHDLGTPVNIIPLNELSSLPWRNLQATHDDEAEKISGEAFAKDLLMRNGACAGCPVGCIHIGMLREQFADKHRFKYRQVSYDYELIFAVGSMLGVTDPEGALKIMDEIEKLGMDCMSTGVALAWATEAFEKGLINVRQTESRLSFGHTESYLHAVWLLGRAANKFYKTLAKGTAKAAAVYGGEDFACVLGQEMAGYATGETFFVAQSHGLRHSHLDHGAYSYDQKHKEKDVEKATKFLVEDEKGRLTLTNMVSCLFARGVYSNDRVAECLASVGQTEAADNIERFSRNTQLLRWKNRFATGFDPSTVKIPKRFTEVVTWKGPIDEDYLAALQKSYAGELVKMGQAALEGE